jgi:hypothetical protein
MRSEYNFSVRSEVRIIDHRLGDLCRIRDCLSVAELQQYLLETGNHRAAIDAGEPESCFPISSLRSAVSQRPSNRRESKYRPD